MNLPSRCAIALATLISSPAFAAGSSATLVDLPVAGTVPVKPASYAAATKMAERRGTPVEVALAIAGPFEGSTQHIIQVNEGSEAPTGARVTLLRDGLLDDSVRGERWEIAFARGPKGAWTIVEVKRAWLCRRGPHTDRFLAVPCS